MSGPNPHEPDASETTGEINALGTTAPAQPHSLADRPDPVPEPAVAGTSHAPAPPAGNYPPRAGTPPYPGPYGAGPYPSPYPFSPTTREPWLNPAKRTMAALLAVLFAVVLLGVGFVVGAAVANHRDRGLTQIDRGGARFGPFGRPGAGHFRGPGIVAPTPVPAVSPTSVTPAPSSSHS